jgi:hypothetical protein
MGSFNYTFIHLIAALLVSLQVPSILYAEPAMKVWVVPGMTRVGLEDSPGKDLTAELYAARNEYESFQIGVRSSAGELTNIKLEVSDLRGADGKTIPRSNFTLYREHYLYVDKSSPADRKATNHPLGKGWYADGLIPFIDVSTGEAPTPSELRAVPHNLEEGKNQAFWIDIFVPPGTSPGQYSGVFAVTCDQGSATGEIKLHVWNFELPLKPSLLSSFGNWNAPPGTEMELLRHRVMPFRVAPKDERRLIDMGLSCVHGGIVSGANTQTCKMASAPSAAALQACFASHERDILLYNYTADEIDRCPDLGPALKEWARSLHSAGFLNLVTMTPRPDLYDDGSGTGRSAVDIWALLPSMYEAAREQVAEVMRKGDQVWFYTALAQDGYSPKWLMDFSPINYRIQPGFINQSMGLGGILYWKVNHWTSDPWNDPMSFRHGQNCFPGEGVLVYPGEIVGIEGVAPSMRLKWIREGVEDFEYVKLSKDRGLGEEALAIVRSIAPDWHNWTRDPQEFEKARIKLGEMLSVK